MTRTPPSSTRRRPAGGWRGPEALRPLCVNIARLTHHRENTRLHGTASIEAIHASLAAFGQQKPVVATPDGCVIAGNGTLAAARALRWPALAVVWFRGTAREASAYAVADNRTAELSVWQDEMLLRRLTAWEHEPARLASVGFSLEARDELAERLATRAAQAERADAREAERRPRAERAAPEAADASAGAPVETLYFADRAARRVWTAFCAGLRDSFPELSSDSARFCAWLAVQYPDAA